MQWNPQKTLSDIISSAFQWHLKKRERVNTFNILREHNLIEGFRNVFKESTQGLLISFAPGRINLIGEHVDYNGGFVLPCAINAGTFMAGKKTEGKTVRFFSEKFEDSLSIALDEEINVSSFGSTNYFAAILKELKNLIDFSQGFDVYCYSNLPIGAGVSSSASFILCAIKLISTLFALKLSEKESALLAQKIEREHLGVLCGIMDQFAIVFGEKDKFIRLHCDTLEYQHFDCSFGNHCLLVVDTNYQRKLEDSKYNERV